MGTRGFLGFVVDGQEKIAYNHWDSYPNDGLGSEILTWLRSATTDLDTVIEKARALRVVPKHSTPSAEDVEVFKEYADINVGSKGLDDWYVLLRRTQGNIGLILEAGVIEDASEFVKDSLWAEWGYIVDLDALKFEVYRGFQQSPHPHGRFADREPVVHALTGPYYPVALVTSWPLNELPSDDDFIRGTRSSDELDQETA